MKLNEDFPISVQLSIINKELKRDLSVASLLSLHSSIEILILNNPNQKSTLKSKSSQIEQRIIAKKNRPVEEDQTISEQLMVMVGLAEIGL